MAWILVKKIILVQCLINPNTTPWGGVELWTSVSRIFLSAFQGSAQY